jgi:hypothetical protein
MDGTDDRASLPSQVLKQRHALCARRAVQTPKTNVTYQPLICQEDDVTAVVREQSAITSFPRLTTHYFVIASHPRSNGPTLENTLKMHLQMRTCNSQNTKKLNILCTL